MIKSKLTTLILNLLLAAPLVAADAAKTNQDPAFLPIDSVLDLKVAKPEVNVNLPRFLLMDAVSELDLGTNSPFAASGVTLQELIKDIKLIRFLVISSDKDNQSHIDQAVGTLTKHLETNWTAIFSVPDENIGVYAMSDPAGESVSGLAVLIHNGGETIIGNIVGRISIGKLVKVASKVDRKNGGAFIPKELIEKLTGASSGASSDAKKEEAKTEEAAKEKTR